MRNIRFVNIIQRLNSLNKNSPAICKHTVASTLSSKPADSYFNGQSKGYSSSNQRSFDFNRTSTIYTLFGASIATGITVNFIFFYLCQFKTTYFRYIC